MSKKCEHSNVQPWGDGSHRCMICSKVFVHDSELEKAKRDLSIAVGFISYEHMPAYEQAIEEDDVSRQENTKQT